MGDWEFTKGLHDLGRGAYAYLQPDGSWCLSNAGLVVEGDRAMLIDTLTDLPHTREMLDALRATTKAAIDTLVITHGNIDHWLGNELVEGAEIVATETCAEEMRAMSPEMLSQLMKAAPQMGETGEYLIHCFSAFDFGGASATYPTRTFTGRITLQVGSKEVQLIDVGPAHTRSDLLVYVPENRVLFAGDILFVGGTPLMWAGPVGNWIKACDMMLDLDVEAYVPGHGPITDKKGVEAVKGYWQYLETEARKRFDAGMGVEEAAMDIDLGEYGAWGESERVCANVHTLYREFRGDDQPADVVELFGLMARYARKRK